MEVLQISSPGVQSSDQSVIFGSWSLEHDGLEVTGYNCFLEGGDEDSTIRDICVLEIPSVDDLENYDFSTEKLGDDKTKMLKQQRRLFQNFRKLFSKKYRKGRAFSKSEKKDDGTVGTASTFAETATSCTASLHTVDSFFFADQDGELQEKMIDPDLLDVLDVLVHYDLEQGTQVETVFPRTISDLSAHEPHAAAVDVDSSFAQDEDSSSLDPVPVHDAPLMQRRLLETGLVQKEDFEFVVDRVSKEVVHMYTEEEKKEEAADDNVSHVKTGIWEVTCFDGQGNPTKPFYIVTGVSMDDRVDTKKLRKMVFAGKSHKRRPKISMAPQDIAEELAGFQSGTMAPICHSENMKLYLEESLVGNKDLAHHRLKVGSGMFGQCLSIRSDKFLEIAKANPNGIEVCSLVRKAKGAKKKGPPVNGTN